jgi:hypothetical protein
MAEQKLLAEKLIEYANSMLLRDRPEMRRDLAKASEWLTAYAALLDAWSAVFVEYETDADIDRPKPHIRLQFAELFGATSSIEVFSLPHHNRNKSWRISPRPRPSSRCRRRK